MSLIDALPAPPAENDPLPAIRLAPEALAFLASRRSTKVIHLAEPGPAGTTLARLLTIAARVPDHGKLAPWRFIVVEGDARAALGEALAGVFQRRFPDAQPPAVQAEAQRFLRSPLTVVVVSRAAPHPKIPEWEQVLSAGAVCHQLLLAAHAAGFGGCWLTGWAAYDAEAKTILGLAAGEQIAGFVPLGTPTTPAQERLRPDVAALTTHWSKP
jgi:nitroreductase